MKTIDKFDLLIVYSQAIAQSTSTKDVTNFPFDPFSRRANYNDAYAYFLKTCAKNNIKAAFTTSADIVSAGKCYSYWIFENKSWIKINRLCSSKFIFDKFSPVNKDQEKKRHLLFSSSSVKPFNDKYLFQLFFDKYKTYLKLKSFSIPTVVLKDGNIETVNNAIQELKKLIERHNKDDFTQDIVIKDRYGAGGNNIYKISINKLEEIQKIVNNHKKISFIIQPFLRFNIGFSYNNFSGFIDIRFIYHNGKIIQTYIRTAKEKDFRCNEHQGGTLVYVSKKDIPQNVLKLSSKIAKIFNKKHALFALDFIVSNENNVYLLEGNTGPGIDWNLSEKINEKRAKLFIRTIVKDLAQTVCTTPTYVAAKTFRPVIMLKKPRISPIPASSLNSNRLIA